MKRIRSVFVLLAFVAGTLLFAHDGPHLMKGTVKAIAADKITVTTTSNETEEIHFDNNTSFEKSGEKASAADLKIGDRVVIHARDTQGTMHAVEVRFGKPKKGDHGQAHSSHPQKPEGHSGPEKKQ